jgi:hypothetical protein
LSFRTPMPTKSGMGVVSTPEDPKSPI